MIINKNNMGNYNVPTDANGVCVDIGSNVGNFFKTYHNRFKKIYAYEPNKILYEMLNSFNIENIEVFNEAVSNKCGKTEIVLHTNSESGSSAIKEVIDDVIVLKNDWSNYVINEVNTVDLETVIKRTNINIIDYLKMDCENSEYLILIKKDLTNIKYIGIEIHHQMGKENWNELKEWVSLTHDGFPDFDGNNKEVLLINKKLC
jgi:FkbM family methyltransferase